MKDNITDREPSLEEKSSTEYVKGDSTNWTAVYRAAFFLEFERFGDEFTLTEEYIMNEYPNRIDQIIIRKPHKSRRPTDDVIAEFFRRMNVIEFKSPADKYDVAACMRALAYPMLLCAYGFSYPCRGERVTEKVSPDDITLTIVSEGRPRKVIEFLKRCCVEYSNPHAGIYRFEKYGSLPVQLIVYREMDDEKHMMLRSLTQKRLPKGAALSLRESLARVGMSGTEDSKRRAKLIMRFLWDKHRELFKEGTNMFELAEMITAEKTSRLVAESEQKGRQEGELKGMFSTLFGLVMDGILSIKDAAARAMVSPADFEARMAAWAASKA